MNRSENTGMSNARMASTETVRSNAGRADDRLPLCRHNRIKSIPQIGSIKALCGSFLARHFARLIKKVFLRPLAAGLGDFPRSRSEIEHGPGRGLS